MSWRFGSVVKNIGCPPRGPEFNPQHPYDGSQLPVTISHGTLCPLLMCRQTCRFKTPIYLKHINKELRKKKTGIGKCKLF